MSPSDGHTQDVDSTSATTATINENALQTVADQDGIASRLTGRQVSAANWPARWPGRAAELSGDRRGAAVEILMLLAHVTSESSLMSVHHEP